MNTDTITEYQAAAPVRTTASLTEQIIVGVIGLFTAGPAGALCSPLILKAVQGKYVPWAMFGVIAAPVLLIGQIAAISAMGGSSNTAPQHEAR